MDIDLNLEHLPVFPRRKDYRIGAIGAGFIMRDIHLVAYKNAGFNVGGDFCQRHRSGPRHCGVERNPQGLRHVAGAFGRRPD